MGPLKEGDIDLYVSDLINRGTCEWNKEMINKTLPLLAQEILELKPSKTGARDSYIWYPATNGVYSTKSGYASAITTTAPDQDSASIPGSLNWYRSVWGISTAPKLQLFLWKSINGALPTGDILRKRGMLQNISCIHYGQIETTEHLLLHCSFAKEVWNLIPLATTFDPAQTSSIKIGIEAATSWACLPPCGITGDIFSWVAWNIWTTRNLLIFESLPASAQATASTALAGAREWLQAQDNNSKSPKSTQIAERPPSPPLGTVTCNTDAAWKKETLDAGLAWIFDTSSFPSTRIESDGCKFEIRVSSALMAEGLAIREALSHARHLGITKIWLQSDSLSLVKAINSISKPMKLYGVLSDIEVLSASFSFCCISFVPREENGSTDMLVKACLFNSVTTWA